MLAFVFAGLTCRDPVDLLRGVRTGLGEAGHDDLPVVGGLAAFPLATVDGPRVVPDGVVVTLLSAESLSAHVEVEPVAPGNLETAVTRALGRLLPHPDLAAEHGLLLALLPARASSPRSGLGPYVASELFERLAAACRERHTPLLAGVLSDQLGSSTAFAVKQVLTDHLVLVRLQTDLALGLCAQHGLVFAPEVYALGERKGPTEYVNELNGESVAGFLRHHPEALTEWVWGCQLPEPGECHIEAPVPSRSSLRFTRALPAGTVLRRAIGGPDFASAGRDCARSAVETGQVLVPSAAIVFGSGLRERVSGRDGLVQDLSGVVNAFDGLPLSACGFLGDGEGVRGAGSASRFGRCGLALAVFGDDTDPATEHARQIHILTRAARHMPLASTSEEITGELFDALEAAGLDGGLVAFSFPNSGGSDVQVHARGEAWKHLRPAEGDDRGGSVRFEDYRRSVVDAVPRLIAVPLERHDATGPEGYLWVQPTALAPPFMLTGFLSALASLTAQACRQRRLDQELEDKLAEIASQWHKPGCKLVDFFRDAARVAAEVTDSSIASIRIVDEDIRALVYSGIYPEVQWPLAARAKTYPLDGNNQASETIRVNAPLLNREVPSIPGYEPVLQTVRHAMHVPMKLEGRAIGVVTVNREVDERYELADQHRLMPLAQQLAAAVVYTQAATRAELQYTVTGEFFGIGADVADASPPTVVRDARPGDLDSDRADAHSLRTILARVAGDVKQALGAGACGIFLRDPEHPDRLMLEAHTTAEHQARIGESMYLVGQGLTGRCVADRRPLRLHRANDAMELRERYGDGPGWKDILHDLGASHDPAQPFIVVPIMVDQGWAEGAVRCSGKGYLEHFTQSDEAMLQAAAHAIAMGVLWARGTAAMAQRDEWLLSLFRLLTHQLHGPVANATAYIETLGPEPDPAALRTANSELQRLDRLVGRLLQYARADDALSAAADERVGLAQVIQECVKDPAVSEFAEHRHVQVACAIAAPGLHVRGDAFLLLQCLDNLVRNALRFSPDGATVTLRLREGRGVKGAAGHLVAEAASGDSDTAQLAPVAVITVHNEGPSVRPEDRDRIFEPLVSIAVDRTNRSSGLGLPLARRIARAFGGDVVLDTARTDQGTALKVLLPLSDGRH